MYSFWLLQLEVHEYCNQISLLGIISIIYRSDFFNLQIEGIHIYVCMYVGINICMCIYVCIYVRICVCVCIYIYICVCVYVCIYVCCNSRLYQRYI
jgi:hypothetical protein